MASLSQKIYVVLNEAIEKLELFQATLKEDYKIQYRHQRTFQSDGEDVKIISIKPMELETQGCFTVANEKGKEYEIPFNWIEVSLLCKISDSINLELTEGVFCVEQGGCDSDGFSSEEKVHFTSKESAEVFMMKGISSCDSGIKYSLSQVG